MSNDPRNEPPSVDLTRLPPDVVALIEALPTGADLVLTRGGSPVATVTRTEADVIDLDARPAEDDASYGNVMVVATAMKLSASARQELGASLGTDYIVLDMHSAPRTTDILLVPPSSPQLIGNLKSMFPKARVVVTEIEDRELGVSYEGPIRRLLDAGAETYLATTSIPNLARQLDHTVTRQQLTGSAPERLQINPDGGAVKPSGVLSGNPDGGAVKPSGVLSGNSGESRPLPE